MTLTTETLTLKRTLQASPERVFNAWIDPELLVQWFGPVGFSVVDTQMHVESGGQYEITIASQNQRITHFGKYITVAKFYQLIFTWVLSDQDCNGSKGLCGDTLVTLNFSGRNQNQLTDLELIHERLPNAKAKKGHEFGWRSSLDCLDHFLGR